jgi:methyl-accepting chemotaxis protein
VAEISSAAQEISSGMAEISSAAEEISSACRKTKPSRMRSALCRIFCDGGY